MIPRIETERLMLREWREGDFEPYAEFMADAEVVRYLNGSPMHRNDAWRNMAAIVGHWVLRGYGFWAVERKSDGRFVGRVGLWNPEGWPAMEVGWTLGRPFWGQGYASEAARASLDHAFENFPVARMISSIHPDNTPSQAVAARIGETKGERREIVIGGAPYPVDIWEIPRERWAARKSA